MATEEEEGRSPEALMAAEGCGLRDYGELLPPRCRRQLGSAELAVNAGMAQFFGTSGFGNSGCSGFGISGTSGFGNVGSSGFGISGNSGFGNVGSSGFGISGTSSFGNVGSSGFGISGISGFGNVGSSGFGISGSSGFGNVGISGNVISRRCLASVLTRAAWIRELWSGVVSGQAYIEVGCGEQEETLRLVGRKNNVLSPQFAAVAAVAACSFDGQWRGFARKLLPVAVRNDVGLPQRKFALESEAAVLIRDELGIMALVGSHLEDAVPVDVLVVDPLLAGDESVGDG
nr:ATP-dependent RNA helicase glh-2-like [Ipomoea batatas]